jgi:hypothetical protein
MDDEDWYSLTYPMFTNAPLSNLDDFWKIVAYTYSWMPTIPDVRPHLIRDPKGLLSMLHLLKSGNVSHLSPLLHELVPVINNSLIGVSKVLHFIAPEQVPIIDRNVLNGWDLFFFKLYPHYNVPQLPHYKTALNLKHIPKYLEYREVLADWVAGGLFEFSMRDLEFAFFDLGRTRIEEEPKLPTYKLLS